MYFHVLTLIITGYLKPVAYQKKSDYDVSGIPLPYRILRQWLFAPGSIDGYTFYRQSKVQPLESKENTIVGMFVLLLIKVLPDASENSNEIQKLSNGSILFIFNEKLL